MSFPIDYTPESVLAAITERQPVKFKALLPSPASSKKLLLGPVIKALLESQAIRKVRIDAEAYYTLPSWEPSVEMIQLHIDGKSRAVEDGCVEWTGRTEAVGGPRFYLISKDGTTKHKSVRRWLWENTERPGKKKTPKLRSRDVIEMRCENDACICMDHMKLRGRNDAMKGRPRPMTVRIKMSRSKAGTKLSWQDVEEIRSSSETGAALALRYGVTQAAISAVRLYKSRRPLGGMFTSLIAA